MSGASNRKLVAVLLAGGLLALAHPRVGAQQAMPPVPPGAVVRRVAMRDAASVEQFRTRLEAMKSGGLFRQSIVGPLPNVPVNHEITFLASGNFLLVIGNQAWVDANIETIRLMGFLYERPRAHLQLNLRVVQLTGPANADVIQMSDAVRALVDAQREEVARTFADLADYLQGRVKARQGEERQVIEAARELLPSLSKGDRPATVPEILLLLMLDRASPAPRALVAPEETESDVQTSLLELPRVLGAALQDGRSDDLTTLRDAQDELEAWKKTVQRAADWCTHFADELRKGKDSNAMGAFRQALEQPELPLPAWLARRLQRSLELTERLYPNLVRRHTEQSLRELSRRFNSALQRVAEIEKELARAEARATRESAAARNDRGQGSRRRSRDAGKDQEPASGEAEAGREAEPERYQAPGALGRQLLQLKAIADELVPAPLALFESVSLSADNAAPTPDQLIQMFREYASERRKLEAQLWKDETPPAAAPAAAATAMPPAPAAAPVTPPARAEETVNYAKLQALEAGLNLWMRRVSESMARTLEQRFYRRYVNELRLLANKQLGTTSSRELLNDSSIDDVPDVTRDLLLSDTGVNIFVSNSVSLQFAPETMNSVSANVQAALPQRLSMLERVQQAQQAGSALSALSTQYGINGEAIVKALLSGGQAVPVQSGINLSASPTIGYDASTVTLQLTANQTLEPGNSKVADRVTSHSIGSATITALSYEPMVLSTLASNVSYYENTGGIPILRRTPLVKSVLKEIPFKPFKEGKRQKGVYQSSVIILEPVVIPTIEDLVRFHTGWREELLPAAGVPPADVAMPGATPAIMRK